MPAEAPSDPLRDLPSRAAEASPDLALTIVTLAGHTEELRVARAATLGELKDLLASRLGCRPHEQRLFRGGSTVPLLADAHASLVESGIQDGERLTLVRAQVSAQFFAWAQVHTDIDVRAGEVFVPQSSCHGGYPVHSMVGFSEGWHRWQIQGVLRNFAAGIVPSEPAREPARDSYGGGPECIWALPSNPDGQAATDTAFPFKSPCILDFWLNFEDRSFSFQCRSEGAEDEARLGPKTAMPLPPGGWRPVVKLTHGACIRLLPTDDHVDF